MSQLFDELKNSFEEKTINDLESGKKFKADNF